KAVVAARHLQLPLLGRRRQRVGDSVQPVRRLHLDLRAGRPVGQRALRARFPAEAPRPREEIKKRGAAAAPTRLFASCGDGYLRLLSHSWPTMPPTTAPPAAPARLPLVTAEPATPPSAAPVAVCCSCFDMCPQPPSIAAASAASTTPIRVFIQISLVIS